MTTMVLPGELLRNTGAAAVAARISLEPRALPHDSRSLTFARGQQPPRMHRRTVVDFHQHGATRSHFRATDLHRLTRIATMPSKTVEFRFFTGLKRQIFRNPRLTGSWDANGRYSDQLSLSPMQEDIGEDSCPIFRASISLDLAIPARRSFGGDS